MLHTDAEASCSEFHVSQTTRLWRFDDQGYYDLQTLTFWETSQLQTVPESAVQHTWSFPYEDPSPVAVEEQRKLLWQVWFGQPIAAQSVTDETTCLKVAAWHGLHAWCTQAVGVIHVIADDASRRTLHALTEHWWPDYELLGNSSGTYTAGKIAKEWKHRDPTYRRAYYYVAEREGQPSAFFDNTRGGMLFKERFVRDVFNERRTIILWTSEPVSWPEICQRSIFTFRLQQPYVVDDDQTWDLLCAYFPAFLSECATLVEAMPRMVAPPTGIKWEQFYEPVSSNVALDASFETALMRTKREQRARLFYCFGPFAVWRLLRHAWHLVWDVDVCASNVTSRALAHGVFELQCTPDASTVAEASKKKFRDELRTLLGKGWIVFLYASERSRFLSSLERDATMLQLKTLPQSGILQAERQISDVVCWQQEARGNQHPNQSETDPRCPPTPELSCTSPARLTDFDSDVKVVAPKDGQLSSVVRSSATFSDTIVAEAKDALLSCLDVPKACHTDFTNVLCRLQRGDLLCLFFFGPRDVWPKLQRFWASFFHGTHRFPLPLFAFNMAKQSQGGRRWTNELNAHLSDVKKTRALAHQCVISWDDCEPSRFLRGSTVHKHLDALWKSGNRPFLVYSERWASFRGFSLEALFMPVPLQTAPVHTDGPETDTPSRIDDVCPDRWYLYGQALASRCHHIDFDLLPGSSPLAYLTWNTQYFAMLRCCYFREFHECRRYFVDDGEETLTLPQFYSLYRKWGKQSRRTVYTYNAFPQSWLDVELSLAGCSRVKHRTRGWLIRTRKLQRPVSTMMRNLKKQIAKRKKQRRLMETRLRKKQRLQRENEQRETASSPTMIVPACEYDGDDDDENHRRYLQKGSSYRRRCELLWEENDDLQRAKLQTFTTAALQQEVNEIEKALAEMDAEEGTQQ